MGERQDEERGDADIASMMEPAGLCDSSCTASTTGSTTAIPEPGAPAGSRASSTGDGTAKRYGSSPRREPRRSGEPSVVIDALRLLQGNMRTMFLFEVCFKIILIAVVMPVQNGVVRLAMHLGGFTYLSPSNINGFLLFPGSWVAFTVVVLLFAFYSLFEICVLIILAHASKSGVELKMRDIIRISAGQANDVVKPRNFIAAIYVLLLAPFTHLGAVSSVVTRIHIPLFIVDYIAQNTLFSLAFIILVIVCLVIAFRLIFSVQWFALTPRISFRAAMGNSKEMIHGNVWYVGSRLFVGILVMMAIDFILGMTGSFLLLVPLTLAVDTHNALMATLIVSMVASWLAMCITVPFMYCFTTALFHRLCRRCSEQIPPVPEARPIRFKKTARTGYAALAAGMVVVVVMLGARYISTEVLGLADSLFRDPGSYQVVAHRGDSYAAPENTLEAFQSAVDKGAEWVELDVRQTSDGVLVVTHDGNLKRTTGLDQPVWATTYPDMRRLDNGSYFSSEFTASYICTLDEALDLCKDKVMLDVEIKSDGHTHDIEQRTIDTIRAHGMEDQVAIASVSYGTLVRAKQYDPDIQTIYNMTLAYGAIQDIPYVDILSVDEAFVNPVLVRSVHEAGKQIFAWTVDNTDDMAQMYLYGVDGIVAGNIDGANQLFE